MSFLFDAFLFVALVASVCAAFVYLLSWYRTWRSSSYDSEKPTTGRPIVTNVIYKREVKILYVSWARHPWQQIPALRKQPVMVVCDPGQETAYNPRHAHNGRRVSAREETELDRQLLALAAAAKTDSKKAAVDKILAAALSDVEAAANDVIAKKQGLTK